MWYVSPHKASEGSRYCCQVIVHTECYRKMLSVAEVVSIHSFFTYSYYIEKLLFVVILTNVCRLLPLLIFIVSFSASTELSIIYICIVSQKI